MRLGIEMDFWVVNETGALSDGRDLLRSTSTHCQSSLNHLLRFAPNRGSPLPASLTASTMFSRRSSELLANGTVACPTGNAPDDLYVGSHLQAWRRSRTYLRRRIGSRKELRRNTHPLQEGKRRPAIEPPYGIRPRARSHQFVAVLLW